MLRRSVPSLVLLALCASPLGAQGLRDKIASELFTYGICGLPLCLQGSLVGHGNHFIPAQVTGTASIIGQITDESGGVLPGVTVTATSPALQVGSVSDVTNEQGEYRLTPLPFGTYAVVYELSGFHNIRPPQSSTRRGTLTDSGKS